MPIVMAYSADAEIGADLINTQKAVLICKTLIELGHPQPPTGTPLPLETTPENDF